MHSLPLYSNFLTKLAMKVQQSLNFTHTKKQISKEEKRPRFHNNNNNNTYATIKKK